MRALSIKIDHRSRAKLLDSDDFEMKGITLYHGWEDKFARCLAKWPSILKSKRTLCECAKQNNLKEKSV